MKRTRCICGTCKTCYNRAWMRRYRAASPVPATKNHTTRVVWAFFTRFPQASLREAAAALFLASPECVGYHLRKLEHLGYIERNGRKARSVRVIVPFVIADRGAV